jgi:hypothetical protein
MAGAVEILDDRFSRAHVQRRSGDGRKEDIRGPRRGGKRHAEQDLEALRAAAEAAGPEAAWSAMAAESHRLRERADFEARVAVCAADPAIFVGGSLPPLALAESGSLDMDDTQPYDDSQEYYNDVNDPWQEIDEDGRLRDWEPPPIVPVPYPTDALNATALLSKFRPARGAVADLKKLLEARADPNITLAGDIHPLSKVMTFALPDRVGPMRDLLLAAGAIENADAKEQWQIRSRADACEEAWMRNFHRDPR